MGLLSEGSPLSWEETKKYADHVRKHGIIQFINLYKKLKDRSNGCLRWGDEVEYMLVKLNRSKKEARLLLNAEQVLAELQRREKERHGDLVTLWRPEYAAYMVEGTPGKPYGHLMAHFNRVEANMRARREEVKKLLADDEYPLSLTAFPRLGCPPFTQPELHPNPEEGASRSLFFPDGAIFQGHPRFRTLTRNIRNRRGEKVAINLPAFKDVNTPWPQLEDLGDLGDDGENPPGRQALPGHVYMDCMGFGMGCSCLQMTFQACSVQEARFLYDQLTPLCPIIMALSAASPVHRGFLCDTDCRWDVIAMSVDDRTREERGLEPLKENRRVISKSRYDSIDSYLSEGSECYNDIELVIDQEIYDQLKHEGIDDLLAKHIAHLFIRDPISLFSEKIHQDDEKDTDHFENIQSTNWQTMRFKPPPPNSTIGWRVEFRPTEVQLTDFENAAFVVFIVLMTRVILTFKLSLLIPISKVDENMRTAVKKDAVKQGKFYFRKDVTTEDSPPVECCACAKKSDCQEEYTLLTVAEIINGKAGEFPGLIPLIKSFLESVDDCDVDTSCTISQYLSLISKRASGELKTTARWVREFVTKHPEYKKDSIVTDAMNFDLMSACQRITDGEISCPDLLPAHSTKSAGGIPLAKEKQEHLLANKFQKKQNGV
uniref:Glutamate--cysteine ligase n=1 Tax=Laeonereis acuta TaxID=280689 RepID=Q5U8Y0_9ANNE|nr:gamma-glutamylcysteine synthetase [Laeonereis acuta]